MFSITKLNRVVAQACATFAMAFVASSAFAQTPPDRDIPKLIAQTDARDISIAPEKRSDLSTCSATEGEAMLTALYNCWPVLQPMQIYHEAGDEFLQTRSTDKRRPGKQNRLLEAADQIIDLTRERKYPMQDMPLILAHLMKMKIFQAQGDYEQGMGEIEKVNAIMETSQITDPNFNRN